MTQRIWVAVASTGMALALNAAAPKLDALYPAGGRPGSTVAPVVLVGKTDQWPVKTWCSHPGIKVECEELKNRFRVTIAPEVAPGAYLVRLFDDSGVSDARPFVIRPEADVLEFGDNENQATAEAIKALPVIVNGRLERDGDSDFYRVELTSGQLLTVALDGYSLGAPIDPFIQLFDPAGYAIAIASDTHNLDPFLQWRVVSDGEYRLQVFAVDHKASTGVGYAGGPAAVYRLFITTDPEARLGLPMVAELDESAATKLAGPTTVTGTLDKPGASDHFTLAAKKGESWRIRVEALRWRYLWDPVLTVYRPDGRLLRETDDSGSADPEYDFKPAVDGDHKLSIADRFGRGGDDFRYRLVIEPARAMASVTVDKDRFEIAAGRSVEMKLKIERDEGHQAELSAEIEGLPDGVTLEAKPVAGKAKAAMLTLKAAADAVAFNGPIRLRLTGKEVDPVVVTHSFITNESRGDYLINDNVDIWLTVLPAAEPAGKTTVKVP